MREQCVSNGHNQAQVSNTHHRPDVRGVRAVLDQLRPTEELEERDEAAA